MILRDVLYFGNEHFLSRFVLPPHSLVISKQPRGHSGLSLISISLEGGEHVQRKRMHENIINKSLQGNLVISSGSEKSQVPSLLPT